jgi:hypothetical protein
MNLSELLKFTIYPNTGYNGVEGYDYSRVFDNGVLLKILQSPSKHRPNDLRIIPSEVIDGYWIQRGNEYLIPLIFLYSALALRLNKKVFTPDVVFTPGISADACGISEYEALKFIDDANLIYKLHLNFTSEFYHRQVSLLSLERSEELFKEINGTNL